MHRQYSELFYELLRAIVVGAWLRMLVNAEQFNCWPDSLCRIECE